MYHILGYVIWESMKSQCKIENLTRRAIEDRCQVFQDAKVKNWSDHELKSQSAKQSTIIRSKTLCAQNTA